MSIRFANGEDLEQIKFLWNISFPEEPEFNAWFFKNVFKVENTLLNCLGDRVCAMLQMIPYEIKMDGKIYPVHYIYGACTQPDFRKKGLMAQLLNYACESGKSKGDIASILIPQKSSLFNFYEKFGYKPGFFLTKIDYMAKDHSYGPQIAAAAEDDIEQMAHLYEVCTKDQNGFILRNQEYWTQQINMFKALDGKVYCLKQDGKLYAYGFVSMIGKKLLIQEGFAINTDDLLSLAEQAAFKENKQDVIILTSYKNQGNKTPLGCIKFLDDRRLPDFSGYMNLMFN